jgi:hypothetical protein
MVDLVVCKKVLQWWSHLIHVAEECIVFSLPVWAKRIIKIYKLNSLEVAHVINDAI